LDGGNVSELEIVKQEITKLAAENLALQFVLLSFLQRFGEAVPPAQPIILKAFDDAANNAEQFSIVRGRQSGHLPETLRVIEQMRLIFAGENKPKREV
jgi:hypothetical protein